MTEIEPTPIRRHGVSWCPALFASTFVLAAVAPPKIAMARTDEGVVMRADPPASTPADESGPLRVMVEPEVGDAALIPGWIFERNQKVAEKLPMSEGHEQWIAVEIGGATYDYRVSVVAMRDGAPVGVVGEPVACECNSEKLLQMVDARIAAAADQLRAAVAEEAAREQEMQGEPEPIVVQPTAAEGSDRPRRLKTMGYVGLGVAMLGAGSVAAGIPLALRPDEPRGEAGTFSSYSTRPPGIGLVVGGGVALVGGIALVVVDLVISKKAKIAVVPSVGPVHAGLFVTRKF